MSAAGQMRMERIQRLLAELEYEVVRGVMEREIEPDFHMSKLFPCGANESAGLEVHCYRTDHLLREQRPNLKLVKD